MVQMPNDVRVKIGIKQGQVYNFSPASDVDNHYFVVLNKNPKDDKEIHLVYFTSKKEKVLKFIEIRNLDRRTCVDVGETECGFLPRKENSGINCNNVLSIDIEKLIVLIDESEGSCCYPAIEDSFLKRVIEGVKMSRLVKPIVKELI
jgi:hypothetical protein